MDLIERCTVCGMEADKNFSSEYEGRIYYFCGPECKERFDANPSQYASAGP